MINDVSCTNFSIASDTRNKDSGGDPLTNFYRVSAWRGLGDTCAKFLHKGDRVAVAGDLLFRTYKDKNGQERAAMQVTLTDIDFLNDRARGENVAQTKPQQSQGSKIKQQTPSQVTLEDDNDELPF